MAAEHAQAGDPNHPDWSPDANSRHREARLAKLTPEQRAAYDAYLEKAAAANVDALDTGVAEVMAEMLVGDRPKPVEAPKPQPRYARFLTDEELEVLKAYFPPAERGKTVDICESGGSLDMMLMRRALDIPWASLPGGRMPGEKLRQRFQMAAERGQVAALKMDLDAGNIALPPKRIEELSKLCEDAERYMSRRKRRSAEAEKLTADRPPRARKRGDVVTT